MGLDAMCCICVSVKRQYSSWSVRRWVQGGERKKVLEWFGSLSKMEQKFRERVLKDCRAGDAVSCGRSLG